MTVLVHVLPFHSILSGLVEDLTRERVVSVVGNVVPYERDDVGLRHSSGLEQLDGIACVCLVAIVGVVIGASHDDSPVVCSDLSNGGCVMEGERVKKEKKSSGLDPG
jgi:hypothetical protein